MTNLATSSSWELATMLTKAISQLQDLTRWTPRPLLQRSSTSYGRMGVSFSINNVVCVVVMESYCCLCYYDVVGVFGLSWVEMYSDLYLDYYLQFYIYIFLSSLGWKKKIYVILFSVFKSSELTTNQVYKHPNNHPKNYPCFIKRPDGKKTLFHLHSTLPYEYSYPTGFV